MADERDTEVLTVAAVRDNGTILFNERHQIFRPGANLKRSSTALRRLNDAAGKREPVFATLDSKRGTVEKIEEPDGRARDTFLSALTFLEKPARPLAIDTRKLDPVTSNIVDLKIKWPTFALCKTVIPNYAKAKEIFDFCAAQTCSLGGPFDISPCIPFQYVIDGCYARAHKMRKIITEKYRFCCEKVFSFAIDGNDELSVKADKWGGCCVNWWYHVAPLVRVKFSFGPGVSFTFAMVIDPGMFDAPVMLSTWLSAQENPACSNNARVSKYSIQSGSAYTPGDFQGITFTTDPGYVKTDQKLTQYANLVTC